mgnify:CR=1 FL=1
MNAYDEIHKLLQRMNRSVIGQERVVERLLLTLLCNGNVLIEGLPGLAKTRAIKTLSKHLESEFRRIQFTPDLLPSDITGSEIYLGEQAKAPFVFQPGPIFSNLVLADEINRAPAKVQSALLEAMEERQVTVAGKTHPMPPLFMVLATQNPVEQEGTYPLPEAQMDRFTIQFSLGYVAPDEEVDINEFTYPGPKPTAKEHAILMMADSVEAASRTLKTYTPGTISDLVEGIVGRQAEESQFSEANLTFADISAAKEIFKNRLSNIYHSRIEYPE